MKPSAHLLRQLSDVDALLEKVDPEAIVNDQFGGEERRLTAKTLRRLTAGAGRAGDLESLETSELPEEPMTAVVDEERRIALAAGRRGLEKIRAEGEFADLAPAEQFGLEAIILLTNRPALLIQRGQLLQVPEEWAVLNNRQENIARLARSVGRVEVQGHPSFEWVGTGFLVADNVIMTNRHVANVFCHKPSGKRTWRFMPNMSARIDYVEEFGVLETAEFEMRSVIGIHDEYDLALFRVRRVSPSGAEKPEPLVIASKPPADQDDPSGRQVITCGYPAWDGRRNDLAEMMRIFANIFNVKRVQPGELRGMDALTLNVVNHDCSTLGGNSGSCVIDLETEQVVGLHFGGRYMDVNKAVALWKLTDDPLLKKARVNFA
jgi:V8-like Glu-specific endopeptidase